MHSDRDQAKDYSILKLKITAFTEIEPKTEPIDLVYPFSQTAGRQPHTNMIIMHDVQEARQISMQP
jgi:hypothetical protein